MVEIIFIAPFLTGCLAFFMPRNPGRVLLVLTGALHLLLSVLLWVQRPEPLFPDFFAVTPEGLLSLLVISLLFFLISIYTTGYLKATEIKSENIFTGSMLLFLSTMTMVTLSDHIMVMWIAIEATTLASAPLIYTHRSSASLEATWKYVLICSVGIALALLGSVLITVAMDAGRVDVPVAFSALTAVAGNLDPLWLKAGFVFILVGYGTKMGLAPMHTWLPDAHSEAPSPASALLSGVLLNCAYLGIFKTNKIMIAAGLGDFSGTILMVFGLISIMAAATFILKQTEYKRMLAYSSIENMGIIAFGTGIGGIGAFGAMVCLIHHSLIKSSLFLTSGNILLGYGSRMIDKTGELVKRMPRTFLAFFAGFAGISGFPPFGIFIGELFIIIGAFRGGHYWGVGIFILSLCVIFAGFANQVLKISYGETDTEIRIPEKANMIWPQYVLLSTSVVLCFWLPDPLYQAIVQAVTSSGGGF
ncbi:MAG: proton-conducting transporter membrane subunit [Desulfobacterales bacterium]|jgi:hydrogenase-4 component F